MDEFILHKVRQVGFNNKIFKYFSICSKDNIILNINYVNYFRLVLTETYISNFASHYFFILDLSQPQLKWLPMLHHLSDFNPPVVCIQDYKIYKIYLKTHIYKCNKRILYTFKTWQNEHTMKNDKSDSKYNIKLQHNTGSYI